MTLVGAALAATDSGLAQSAKVTLDSNVGDVVDRTGQTVGKVFYNRKKTVSLTVIPAGTTVALAQAAAVAWMPLPGTAVTVTEAAPTIFGGVQSGKFNCISSTANQTNDGAATVDIELEQFEDADVSLAIS